MKHTKHNSSLRNRSNLKEAIRKDLVVLIFSLIFLTLFCITFVLINDGFFHKTDELVNSYFSTPSNTFFTNLSLILSFVFDPLSIIVISSIIFIFLFSHRFKRDSLFFLAVSLLGGILILGFKEIFRIIRPDNLYESGFSFPSGHATISIILFCSLVYFLFKHSKSNYKYLISILVFFFVILLDFSRLYLGVHWFSDIIGGVFLGAFLFLFAVYFFEKIE